MKTRNIILAGFLTLGLNSLYANQNNYKNHHNNNNNFTMVKVNKSEPIYKTVNIRVPYDEVVSKSYTVSVPCGQEYSDVDNNSFGIDTLVGVGIGAAIGNQIGNGNGKVAARVIGGLIGANIANQNRRSSYQTKYCNETRYKDEVVTRYDYITKEKLQGYRNTFSFNGKTYTKITNHPRKKIRVRTSISY